MVRVASVISAVASTSRPPISNQQKATHLAHAAVIHGDIASADREFDLLMEATAADVQRVARTYFTPANRLILRVLPPS